MSDENDSLKKFKFYFIGVIVFILAVVLLLLSTGRGVWA